MTARWAGVLAALGVGALLLLGPPAQAQTPASQRSEVAAGLQAQFEVALIRERKMADDRETQLIAALEAKLKAARVQADAARGDARQANAALAAARADYAKLAGQIVGRDPGVQGDITAYQTQTEAVVAKASPEKLAALQRFADGDRVGAWPVLQSLTAAEDAAPGATAASRAANARQLAQLRDEMRAHGEATTADVLALYDKANDLDPSNFKTDLERARLARDLGDLVRAKADAKQAIAVAATESERASALKTIGEQGAQQDDRAEAEQDYDQALASLQKIVAADPTTGEQNELAGVLQDKCDLDVALTDFKAAQAFCDQALVIRRQLAAANPNDAALQDYVTSVYQRIGDLDVATGDLPGARAAYQQGLTIRQNLEAADPSNTDLQYYASALLRRLGDVAFKQNDLKTARASYEAVLAIRQKLLAQNPSSGQLLDAVALDFFDLGEVQYAQNEVAAAQKSYEQSLGLWKSLALADPTDAPLQQLILRDMTRLARIPGSSVGWPDVADEYRLIEQQHHLIPNDQRVYDALRAHHLDTGL